jgi:hypothetical protein
MGAKNRVGIGLSYRPARLHRLAEFILWNRFLGSIIRDLSIQDKCLSKIIPWGFQGPPRVYLSSVRLRKSQSHIFSHLIIATARFQGPRLFNLRSRKNVDFKKYSGNQSVLQISLAPVWFINSLINKLISAISLLIPS